MRASIGCIAAMVCTMGFASDAAEPEINPSIAPLTSMSCNTCEPSIRQGHKEFFADVASLASRAHKGDKEAQFELALKYHNGDGVQADIGKAVFWYTRAANAGHLNAMRVLASLYYLGNGVKQDSTKAIQLYKKVADTGDLAGITSLAGVYLDGKGVPQDYIEARKLLMFAAERGYAPAQNAIGVMYRFGWGVKKDSVEAYAWWILAASNGDSAALGNMKGLELKLSPSDIGHAQERSKQLICNEIMQERE